MCWLAGKIVPSQRAQTSRVARLHRLPTPSLSMVAKLSLVNINHMSHICEIANWIAKLSCGEPMDHMHVPLCFRPTISISTISRSLARACGDELITFSHSLFPTFINSSVVGSSSRSLPSCSHSAAVDTNRRAADRRGAAIAFHFTRRTRSSVRCCLHRVRHTRSGTRAAQRARGTWCQHADASPYSSLRSRTLRFCGAYCSHSARGGIDSDAPE